MSKYDYEKYIDYLDKILTTVCSHITITDNEIEAEYQNIKKSDIHACLEYLKSEGFITIGYQSNKICLPTIKGILYINEGGINGNLKRNRRIIRLSNWSMVSTIIYAFLTFLMLTLMFSSQCSSNENSQKQYIVIVQNAPLARI